jgi:hypothetical protein
LPVQKKYELAIRDRLQRINGDFRQRHVNLAAALLRTEKQLVALEMRLLQADDSANPHPRVAERQGRGP